MMVVQLVMVPAEECLTLSCRRTITMSQSSTSIDARRFSPRVTLAALGLKLRSLDLFGPIRQTVTIPQKTVKHTPSQKLFDAFITLLTGAHGLVGFRWAVLMSGIVRRDSFEERDRDAVRSM
jgi:hypothetical protein